jgi:membrane-bound metal-dependent hydrolase YbcI (DUF457 family)
VDLFTHVLVAYLLSFGIVGFQPQYLAAGALAGGLPDADALFFPLSRRFPILRHHGITHSIFGVTVVAVVGGLFLAPRLAPGNPLLYFVVMEIGGLSHMLEDGFTHFSVPPLLPFSDRRLELDADRAINFLTLLVSVSAFYLLLGVERNHVAFALYVATVYGLMAFFGIYFGVRLAARFVIGRKLRRIGVYRVPIPTGNPFRWLLLDERKEGGRVMTRYVRYTFGKGITLGPFSVDVPMSGGPGPAGPAHSASEALERSYPIARTTSSIFDDTYHFGEAKAAADGWYAIWYSLEFTAFGRAAAVEVHLKNDGTTNVRRAWHTRLWRKELT